MLNPRVDPPSLIIIVVRPVLAPSTLAPPTSLMATIRRVAILRILPIPQCSWIVGPDHAIASTRVTLIITIELLFVFSLTSLILCGVYDCLARCLLIVLIDETSVVVGQALICSTRAALNFYLTVEISVGTVPLARVYLLVIVAVLALPLGLLLLGQRVGGVRLLVCDFCGTLLVFASWCLG